jgi:hypothetical protein
MSDSINDMNIDMSDQSCHLLKWWAVICIVVIVLSGLYVIESFQIVTIKTNLHQVGSDVFLKYLFIVIAVERAVAVLVSMLRSPSKVDWSLRLKRVNQILAMENPHIADFKKAYALEKRLLKTLEVKELIGEFEEDESLKEGKGDSQQSIIENYQGYLISVKHIYEFQQARFDAISKRYVDQAVFLSGVILAVLGVSLFNDLFESIHLLSGAQTWLLKIVDILITAGLLGGGSAGLNVVANKLSQSLVSARLSR